MESLADVCLFLFFYFAAAHNSGTWNVGGRSAESRHARSRVRRFAITDQVPCQIIMRYHVGSYFIFELPCQFRRLLVRGQVGALIKFLIHLYCIHAIGNCSMLG